MTDEELIISTLDRYYRVVVSRYRDYHNVTGFVISDKENDNRVFNDKHFLNTFKALFGEYITDTGEKSTDIYIKWVTEQKFILTEELGVYIKTMDMSRGSKILLEELLSYFETDNRWPQDFLRDFFITTYNNLIISPNLGRVFDSLDLSKKSKNLLDDLTKIYEKDLDEHSSIIYKEFLTYYITNKFTDVIIEYTDNFDKNQNSSTLISDFTSKFLVDEMNSLYEFSCDKLNKWYSEVVLKEKLDKLFSEFVITLGRTNWRVTWIGHGELTDFKLREIFKDENDSQRQYVIGYYDEWYENKIFERSEYYMKNSMI